VSTPSKILHFQWFFQFLMGGYRMSLMVMATRLTLPALGLSAGADEKI
jgi:hypothetical protein